MRSFRGASGGEQALVEGAEAAGLRGGEAGDRRLLAVRPQHREFAPHHFEPRILPEQALDVGIGRAAEAAGIIEEFDEDDIAAVVADIMSNPSEALEIATGYVDRIYVLVPNNNGQFQVARGGVYSYYEFWVPRDQRLTDEEWWALLGSNPPERPDWQNPLFPAGLP